jgi:hypothetical protein
MSICHMNRVLKIPIATAGEDGLFSHCISLNLHLDIEPFASRILEQMSVPCTA